MNDLLFACLMLLVLFGLIGLRMPVGIALLLVGGIGYLELTSWNALLSFLKTSVVGRVANYNLSVVTLFVFMGELATHAGLGARLFGAANAWLGHRRGGLAMASIGGCAGFGAICGSSLATVATMSRIALPEMRRYGYSGRLATSSLAAGGTLGILIPPSIVLVIYAILTEQSLGDLFIAAIVPGILASLLYILAIAVYVRFNKEAGPAGERHSWGERFRALSGVLPLGAVFLLVMGGMYTGWFTPTEAAAVGTVAVAIIAFISGLGLKGFAGAIRNTAAISAMCFMILIGAELFNSFLALTRMPMQLAGLTESIGLPAIGVIVVMMLIYLLLGCVMDSMSTILLTVPVFFPVVAGLDLGMSPDAVGVWFGILALMTCEIGLITPPFGLNVFVINGIARDVPIGETFKGVVPFFISDIIRVGLVIAFPAIALALPNL